MKIANPLKPARPTKVIGLALGEKTLLAAEIAVEPQPRVRKIAEFVYPPGTSLQEPAKLGEALGEFLKIEGFSARSAAVGIPARWLVVRPKEVPPADPATLAAMLRLQAEGEFSTELKDLVYDYAGAAQTTDRASNVLLVATPRQHVDSATALCEAAGLKAVVVTASAVALGSATARGDSSDALVLTMTAAGAELTAQRGLMPTAIRHVRPATGEKAMAGELRRALASVGGNGAINGAGRELVVWDASSPAGPSVFEDSTGLRIRRADIPSLGVDAGGTAAANGSGRKYAPAVAVALAALGETPAIDFLHSRLAPPRERRLPHWAPLVGGIAAVLLLVGITAYAMLQHDQTRLNDTQAELDRTKDDVKAATEFNGMVGLAQRWHTADPRYLACFRDMTQAIPDDLATYATNVTVREQSRIGPGGKPIDTGMLLGQLYGKTADQQRVQVMVESLKKVPSFTSVTLGGTQPAAGKEREVAFTVTFIYKPPVRKKP